MKILFFNPATTQKRFVPFEAIRGSAFFRRPNYDAMRLSFLSGRHDFVYYDERIEEKPDFNPDLIVVNTPLNLARYVQSTIRNKWGKKAKIICYGFYSTLFPNENKKFADSVVIGDIANIWHTIIGDARQGHLASKYMSNRNDKYHVDRSIEQKYGFTPVLSQLRTSFGCTCPSHHKDFCYESIIYRDQTKWDLNEAIKEVSRIKRKIIFMRDDDFLHNQDYAVQFLEKCWRFKKMWIFQTSGNLFNNPQTISLLRDTGVRIIHFKEDWLSDTIHQNIDDNEYFKNKQKQVSIIHKNRITCGCKLRLGHYEENFNFYNKLLKFLLKIKMDFIKVTAQMPIPQTYTYRKLKRKKYIARDLTLYDRWMPVVHTPGITPQALYSWMEWLRDRFYSWDSILFRNIFISTRLGFYNTVFFYLIPNLSYRNNFLEKVGYPP